METNNNFKEASERIIKFLKNELSAEERKDFELWRSSNLQNEALVQSFKDTASVQQEVNYLHQVDVAQGLDRVLRQIGTKKQPKFLSLSRVMWYSSAAVILITLGVAVYHFVPTQFPLTTVPLAQTVKNDIMPGAEKAIFQMADGSSVDLSKSSLHLTQKDGTVIGAKDGIIVYKSTKGNKGGYNLLRTPRAGEYRMVLDDGTRVWLNASSSLRFPASFNKSERRVELTGEGYFEVAHNKSLPFVVRFNNTEVKVLGTHFNISSYGAESKTTLIEGSVVVTKGSKEETLKPGDQAVVGATVTVQPADTYKSIAWKEGVFYFNEDQMTDILDQVARWYDVKIVYKGNPNAKRYSGNIRRQATLNQVLEMLNVVSGAEFTLQNRTVTVDFNK